MNILKKIKKLYNGKKTEKTKEWDSKDFLEEKKEFLINSKKRDQEALKQLNNLLDKWLETGEIEFIIKGVDSIIAKRER